MFKRIISIITITILIFAIGTTVLAEDDTTLGYMTKTGSYALDGDISWEVHAGSLETGAQQKTIIKGQGELFKSSSLNIQLGKLEASEEIVWSTHEKALRNLKVVSAINLAVSPADAVYKTDQIYAWLIIPEPGESGYVNYSFTATEGEGIDGEDYVGAFDIDFEADVSLGQFGRYISMSSEKAKSPLVDDLRVIGSATVAEVFAMYDELTPLQGAINWWDLF